MRRRPGSEPTGSAAIATHQLARSLRDHSRRAVGYFQQDRALHMAEVVTLGPDWSAELHEGNILLTSERLVATQWVEQYHAQYGVQVGDTVMVASMPDGSWVMHDVISDTSVAHI